MPSLTQGGSVDCRHDCRN